eukprot:1779530-Alexandrium_andersonii.AAC.1
MCIRDRVQGGDLYPIPAEACLVNEKVTVFRGAEAEGYPFLQNPFRISLVSCAAAVSSGL